MKTHRSNTPVNHTAEADKQAQPERTCPVCGSEYCSHFLGGPHPAECTHCTDDLEQLWTEVEDAVGDSLNNAEGRVSKWYLEHHFMKAGLGVFRLPDEPVGLQAAAPDLLTELVSAQEHVCSLLCPSVKKTGDEWTHSERCKAITAAIAKATA